MTTFKSKIEVVQKILAEAKDSKDIDNSKIIETINIKLENLSIIREQDPEEFNLNTNKAIKYTNSSNITPNLVVDNVLSDSPASNKFKSVTNEYYVKKKIYNHSNNISNSNPNLMNI